MDDRELLELAAKACGELTPNWYGNDAYFNGVLSRWNPLENDGDAFRLALKLRFIVNGGGSLGSRLPFSAVWRNEDKISASVPHMGDPCKSTRRAIVEAAADIGRKMQ